MTRKQIVVRLGEIRLLQAKTKQSTGHRDQGLVVEQSTLEVILSSNSYDPDPVDRYRTQSAREPKKDIVPRKITPVYIDDYSGARCDFCGGKLVDHICLNMSSDWPHPPMEKNDVHA